MCTVLSMPERQVPPPRTTLRWLAILGPRAGDPRDRPWRAGQREAHRSRKAHESGLGRGQGRVGRTASRGASPRPPCVPSSATCSPTRRKKYASPRSRSRPQQPPALPLLITVGGGRTTPVTVVVAPGTRLHFENRDPFPHELYGVGQTTFPPGEMVAMAARDWTAPGPGKYEISDELSPSIRSWVVVEPNVAAIAYPSAATGCVRHPSASAGRVHAAGILLGQPGGYAQDLRARWRQRRRRHAGRTKARSTRTSPTPGRRTKHAALALLVRRDGGRPRGGHVRALLVDQHVRSRQRPRDGRGPRRRQPGRRLVPSRRRAQARHRRSSSPRSTTTSAPTSPSRASRPRRSRPTPKRRSQLR